jgi:hypothetical protein
VPILFPYLGVDCGVARPPAGLRGRPRGTCHPEKHASAEAIVLFEIEGEAQPDELGYRPFGERSKRVLCEFE